MAAFNCVVAAGERASNTKRRNGQFGLADSGAHYVDVVSLAGVANVTADDDVADI